MPSTNTATLKKAAPVVALMATAGVLVLLTLASTSQPQPCPEDYSSYDAYSKSIEAMADGYFQEHPNATLGDFLESRYEYLNGNNCNI